MKCGYLQKVLTPNITSGKNTDQEKNNIDLSRHFTKLNYLCTSVYALLFC